MDTSNEENQFKRIIANTVGGVLTRLFCKILLDNRVTVNAFDRLLSNYFERCKRNPNVARQVKAHDQGNWRRAFLANPELTWQNFCRAMEVLTRPRFDIIIRVHHPDGSHTDSTLPVDITNLVESADGLPPSEKDVAIGLLDRLEKKHGKRPKGRTVSDDSEKDRE